MCNNNYLGANFHDALILKRYVDRKRGELFKRLYKRLQELEAKKREYERQISECLADKKWVRARVSFRGVRRPHVVIEVTVRLPGHEVVTGLGIARCWESKDKWDEEEGKRIATEKAVRHAARKLAGLEK